MPVTLREHQCKYFFVYCVFAMSQGSEETNSEPTTSNTPANHDQLQLSNGPQSSETLLKVCYIHDSTVHFNPRNNTYIMINTKQ